MAPGELFESLAYKYLKHTYGSFAHFHHEGGSDSTVPDIHVTTKRGNPFNIEVKSPQAQSSQFVVKLKNNKFHLSKLDKGERLNHDAPIYHLEKLILNKMSQNVQYYTDPHSRRVIFSNCQQDAYDWVKSYYNSKNNFFITNSNFSNNKLSGDFYIFPISHFQDYFNIRINSRYKQSGSRPAGKTFNKIADVKQQLSNRGFNVNVQRSGYRIYLNFIGKRPKKNIYLSIQGLPTKLFINKHPNSLSKYELKKTSSTANLTVIFQIILKNYIKKSISRSDKNEFVNYIKNN